MAAGFERIRHVDLTEATYDAIRHRILRREMATGEQIPVDAVAAGLGVSRTPVIDALRRLAAEGLVEIRARRGCFVRPLTVDDVREVFEVREAVELFALRLALGAGRQAALARRLQAALRGMARHTAGDVYTSYDKFIEWDRAFHVAIVEAGGNSRLDEIYGNLHVHLHIMRAHYVRELESASQVNADHSAIAEAVGRGDLAAAERAVSAHLHAIRRRMTSNLERDGGRL